MTQTGPTLLDLTAAALRAEIEPRLRKVRAAKGRTVMGAGARSDEVFLVLEGEAGVAMHSAEGREVSVRRLGPGDVFGDLGAVDGLPRSASVVALSDLRLIAMSRNDFLACVASSPDASMWFARRLVREVRRLTDKVFELSALNVRARLLCELLRLARAAPGDEGGGVVIRPAPTQSELASRIATHREAVTREMRNLNDRGVIVHHRRSLEFPDLRLLEQEVARAVGVPATPDEDDEDWRGSGRW
jgi:CRP-like cAMP-binding protein